MNTKTLPSFAQRVNSAHDRLTELRKLTPAQLVYLNRNGLLTIYAESYQHVLEDLTARDLYAIINDPQTAAEIVWGSVEETEFCSCHVHPVTLAPIHAEAPYKPTVQDKISAIGTAPAEEARRILAGMPAKIIQMMTVTGCLTVEKDGDPMEEPPMHLVWQLLRGKALPWYSLIWMPDTVDERDLSADDGIDDETRAEYELWLDSMC